MEGRVKPELSTGHIFEYHSGCELSFPCFLRTLRKIGVYGKRKAGYVVG